MLSYYSMTQKDAILLLVKMFPTPAIIYYQTSVVKLCHAVSH